MEIELKVIPFCNLEETFQTSDETLKEQQEYNTHFHTLEEISTVLPQLNHIAPSATQPFLPFKPWLDLIKSSQGLSDLDVHEIQLPKPFLSHVLAATELLPRRTTLGSDIETLLREGRYFARLDTCSLKDAVIGKGSVRDSKDLWTRLATSNRGANGIRAMCDNFPDQPVPLFLIKWDDKMRTDLEYRIFCAPGCGQIAAISQYKWHAPWYHARKGIDRQKEIAKRVFEGAKALHRQIMTHEAMTEDLRRRGFVFDIVDDPDDGHAIRLVELNDFGAMTGCGS
ncbi:MAG: hypothetical protein Q9180_007967, partial [Flavoplaca navasiana]